jgi:hypothetical protein
MKKFLKFINIPETDEEKAEMKEKAINTAKKLGVGLAVTAAAAIGYAIGAKTGGSNNNDGEDTDPEYALPEADEECMTDEDTMVEEPEEDEEDETKQNGEDAE